MPPDGPAPERDSSGDPTEPPAFTTAPPGASGLPHRVEGTPTTQSAPSFHDPPYSGPSHPLPMWVPPIRTTLSPHRGRRERRVWLIVVVIIVGALALWLGSIVWGFVSGPAPAEPFGAEDAGPVMTTLPPLDPEDAALYDEVRCRFSGSSTVEPGVRISDDVRTPQRMELLPGATFDCVSVEGRTTGAIRLTTDMPSMNAFRGEGTATGVIDWSVVGPGIPEELGRTSNLTAEVELAYPNVILLFTIQDGPWAGYKGRVVLAKWTFQHDAQGRIVQVDFEPTDLVLSES